MDRDRTMSTPPTKNEPVAAEEPLPDILTVEQAAHYLQISRSALYKLIEAGRIPHRRIGGEQKGSIRFSKRQLLDWVEGKGQENEKATG
jgi:excisionase family DNA binding protein